jgi:hypothetical protein
LVEDSAEARFAITSRSQPSRSQDAGACLGLHR